MREVKKTYLAVVVGVPDPKEGRYVIVFIRNNHIIINATKRIVVPIAIVSNKLQGEKTVVRDERDGSFLSLSLSPFTISSHLLLHSSS